MLPQPTATTYRHSANLFSILGVVAIALVLIAAGYRAAGTPEQLNSWETMLYRAMLLYLVFISLRTMLLILFSFADRFFQRALQPITTFPLVSVIIPCFNEETVVHQTIESIMGMDYPNLDIIVVDDGSTDQTLTVAKGYENGKRVRVVHQRNAGKAAVLNRGISEALGEFVLCVDADSVLSENVIRDGLAYFVQDPKLAAVAGNVQIGNTSRNLLTKFQQLEYIIGLNFHKSAQSFLSTVNIVPGPVGLFRRSALVSIGGYRSETFAEDADLTLRLLVGGHRIAYSPRMIAITEAPEDFTSLLKQRYRWSRGMVQAVKLNAYYLFRPWKNFRNFSILLYTTIETAVIPSINFLFAMLFIEHAVLTGRPVILGPFFLQLMTLDVILTVYSVLTERQVVSLVLLSMVNRLTYGLSLEVLRFFSIIDEVLGLPMSWNKLERKGL